MAWMLSTVLRNAANKPATRRYPFEKRAPFAGARGQLLVDHSTCVYCTACARRCPCGAIRVDRQKKEFAFDPFRCIVCGACVEACAKNSLSLSGEHRGPAAEKSTVSFSG